VVSRVGQNSCARVSAGRSRAGTRAEATRDQRYKNEPSPGGSSTVTPRHLGDREAQRPFLAVDGDGTYGLGLIQLYHLRGASWRCVRLRSGSFVVRCEMLSRWVVCLHNIFFAVPSQEEQALGCLLRRCLIRRCGRNVRIAMQVRLRHSNARDLAGHLTLRLPSRAASPPCVPGDDCIHAYVCYPQ
jgi:hypothetical protein